MFNHFPGVTDCAAKATRLFCDAYGAMANRIRLTPPPTGRNLNVDRLGIITFKRDRLTITEDEEKPRIVNRNRRRNRQPFRLLVYISLDPDARREHESLCVSGHSSGFYTYSFTLHIVAAPVKWIPLYHYMPINRLLKIGEDAF